MLVDAPAVQTPTGNGVGVAKTFPRKLVAINSIVSAIAWKARPSKPNTTSIMLHLRHTIDKLMIDVGVVKKIFSTFFSGKFANIAL